MSLPLVILITCGYFYTAIEQYWNGNQAVGLMFFGYTIANFGIMGVLK